jgi:magnesium-protoporphyrin O-methyltransferase
VASRPPSGEDPPGDRPACGPGCACTVGNEFGERQARHDLRAYRKSGPDRTTRWLIEGLRAGGVDGLTVLDIGAGVGAVHHELLADGAVEAVDVDGSPAYVAVAREEAERRGVAARVRYEVGDFVSLAPAIEGSDLVALDRVICCYPDMESLVRLSVARARRRYGLVYPRDTWWIRAGGRVLNGLSRVFRQRTRAYVHRTADVESIVRDAGFAPRLRRGTLFWQVAVFEREPAVG